MTTPVGASVVVVLADRKRLHQLHSQLAERQPPMVQLLAIGEGETAFADVARLNPAAARQRRQRSMARWLIPFGFFAGLTFTYMTDLDTFAFAGEWSQHLVGALLGMGSGWMGSFAAAASVSSEEDDRIRSLRNRLEEGSWLLLVETPFGVEMPWALLQQAKPRAVVRLDD
ncbi:hypothetical protein [Cyanobium sp. HWJ4-Hawea]|uniref:hypothetical protein n=1 Tax=Cyanobium sp. HWJ4-Hawea TaxID=2823713 RepID=UPI0020CDBC2A|nr:hypothetical protein [Cyanobium sp. HWJ4-Hawea]